MAEILTSGEKKALDNARVQVRRGAGLNAIDAVVLVTAVDRLLELLEDGGTNPPPGDRQRATL